MAPFLVFLDDDNFLKPHALATLARSAELSHAHILTMVNEKWPRAAAPPNADASSERWLPLGGAAVVRVATRWGLLVGWWTLRSVVAGRDAARHPAVHRARPSLPVSRIHIGAGGSAAKSGSGVGEERWGGGTRSRLGPEGAGDGAPEEREKTAEPSPTSYAEMSGAGRPSPCAAPRPWRTA